MQNKMVPKTEDLAGLLPSISLSLMGNSGIELPLSTSSKELSSRLQLTKRARFVENLEGHSFHSEYSRNSKHSTTRLPASKDGFLRVCHFSHRRWRPGLINSEPRKVREPLEKRKSPESGKTKRFIFGETDYLRDKLGFCMPPVRQTLASESWNKETESARHGMRQISKQRLLTIKSLFQEKASSRRHQHFWRRGKRNLQPKLPEGDKELKVRKGSSEAQQYIVLLDANTRRAKHVDDRAKFALSQEMCRQGSQRLTFDSFSFLDSQLLMSTKKHLEAEREKQRQKNLQKQVRIMMPKKCSVSEESEDSSDM